jgi:hypothetical protein
MSDYIVQPIRDITWPLWKPVGKPGNENYYSSSGNNYYNAITEGLLHLTTPRIHPPSFSNLWSVSHGVDPCWCAIYYVLMDPDYEFVPSVSRGDVLWAIHDHFLVEQGHIVRPPDGIKLFNISYVWEHHNRHYMAGLLPGYHTKVLRMDPDCIIRLGPPLLIDEPFPYFDPMIEYVALDSDVHRDVLSDRSDTPDFVNDQ